MVDLRQKQQGDSQKSTNDFVLSDVSKEELLRRRIPVYDYVL